MLLQSATWVAVAAPSEAPPSGDSGELEPITVTAQRRAEDIQKVPIAITALSGDRLAQSGVFNVTGISSQVPNMATSTPYGDAIPVFSLRGVSAVDFSQNQSSPVATYVDEVYKGLPVLTSLQVFDVDRVEVLRGPQGTLYGKNTTGGAVNFFTRTASVDAGYNGYINAGLGSLNRRELSGAVGAPLGDKFAVRLAAQVTRVDGMVKNFYPGASDQGEIRDSAVRLSAEWVPSDSLKVLFRFTATESTPTAYGIIAANIGRAGPGGVGYGTNYSREGLSFWENSADTTGVTRIRNQGGSVTVKWDINDKVAFTSISSFDQGKWLTTEDGDGSPFNILTDRYDNSAHAISEDLRFSSRGGGALTWLAGLYWYKDSVHVQTKNQYYHAFSALDSAGQPLCFDDFFTGCSVSNDFQQRRDSYAAYAQGTYAITDRLSLTAGLRYTKDRNHLDRYEGWLGYLDPTTQVEVPKAVQTITAPPIDRLDTTNVSGKLGVQYQVSDAVMAYASISRGYRGGSFNGQAFYSADEVTVANPEKVNAYEIGAKAQFFDNHVRLNGAAFYYDYKNQQFLNVTPQLLLILYNAPKSRLYGTEFELEARPAEPLTVRLGGSYLNGKYQEAELQGQNVSGNTMILAPEWTITGGLDWTFLKAGWGSMTLHTDSRYTSKVYYDPFDTEAVAQRGYTLHDARITTELKALPLEVTAWVHNIGKKEYYVYLLNLAPSFNFDYAQRGRPREYGVSVRYSF